MMVLVLGDNFEVFLAILIGQNRRLYSLFVDVSHELFGNDASATAHELDCEFFAPCENS